MPHVETLILGAGPTGLGAAWRLHELGETDWLVLEAGETPGGMAASETDAAGFTWDLGGHVIHSHFSYFDDVLETVQEWVHPRRSGWVRLGDRFIPTPIQRHLGTLAADVGQAITDELTSLPTGPEHNLQDYFVNTFGRTLTDVFFRPFNEKMWAHPTTLVDHTWTSLRSGSGARNVPLPQVGLSTESRPDDTSPFPYPLHGTGAMWAEIASHLPPERLRYGATVHHIDLQARVAQCVDDTRYTFDHCISTVPLRGLLSSLTDEPYLRQRAAGLLHSSVHAVGLGYEGDIPPQLDGVSWIYSPGAAEPFYRSTVLSNYSPTIAGPGRWSILHEVSTSVYRPVDPTTVVRRCLDAMRGWGIEATPVSSWQRHLPYGYPVPFVGRDSLLDPLLAVLESHGVRSRGRFGGWRYESCNQDYAFMQGVEAVDADRVGSEETVFWAERRVHSEAATACVG